MYLSHLIMELKLKKKTTDYGLKKKHRFRFCTDLGISNPKVSTQWSNIMYERTKGLK